MNKDKPFASYSTQEVHDLLAPAQEPLDVDGLVERCKSMSDQTIGELSKNLGDAADALARQADLIKQYEAIPVEDMEEQIARLQAENERLRDYEKAAAELSSDVTRLGQENDYLRRKLATMEPQ